MAIMKRILLVATFIISIAIQAQPSQGGRGGMQGGRPPMRGQMQGQGQSNEEFWVMNLPEIPELTQDQRRKLVDTLTKEKKEVSKLMKEKKDLEIEMETTVDPSKKELDKLIKKIDKVDASIWKRTADYDKKYRKILTVEQYMVFKEKKKEIIFKRPGGMNNRFPNMEGERPQRSDFGNTPPQLPGFDGETGEMFN